MNGQHRIVFFLKSSIESMVTKEKKTILKLVDDFGKFKAYQINYSGYRFDYKVDLGQIIIKKNNNFNLDMVNGNFVVHDSKNILHKLKNFADFEDFKFAKMDIDLTLYAPKVWESY